MDKQSTLLIVDTDVIYAKNLADYVKENTDFFDAQYVTNGKEALEMISIMKPTAVIIDFLIPELDAIGFLRQLRNIEDTAKPYVIINSHTMTPSMINTASSYGANYFMVKPQPFSEICNTISDLTSSHTSVSNNTTMYEADNIDIKISRFLHYMGVPAHLNGYNYIRSSLRLVIEDISLLSPITQKLYRVIARKYNKSPECIERSIRHAIKVSWERGNKKMIYDIFGYTPDGKYSVCPTNSEYIAMLADDLRLRSKHNIAI